VKATREAFGGRPLDWREVDCARMLHFHLQMMGHEPPPLPNYCTALGAARQLNRLGGLPAVLDGMGLERIAPLMMLPGDVGVLPGEAGMDAAIIWEWRKGIGFHEDSDTLANMTPDFSQMLAWRV
jgi:hypothetical protein